MKTKNYFLLPSCYGLFHYQSYGLQDVMMMMMISRG